jgi:small subunit ribosomal protein S1
VKVKIIEIDSERRRLSLSLKRVEAEVPEELATAEDTAVAAPEQQGETAEPELAADAEPAAQQD